MADIQTTSFSETAASNNAAPPDGMPEGQAASSVNDSAREFMGAIKRAWNRDHATLTSAGTTSAVTLTYTVAPPAYVQGLRFKFRVGVAAASATLNVNGLGAKALRSNRTRSFATLDVGVLVAADFDAVADCFFVTTGGRSLQTLPNRAAPRVRFAIGNTSSSLPDGSSIDTTNNSLNCAKLFWVPRRAGMTDIVLGFPGFGVGVSVSPSEQDLPGPYTVEDASVEYPLGTTPQRVYFGGATSTEVLPGRVMVYADPLPIFATPGSQGKVKAFIRWSGGSFWLTAWGGALGAGEWTERGVDLVSQAMSLSVRTTTSNLFGFGPMVFATPNVVAPILGINGDSIAQALNDQPDPTVFQPGLGRAMRGEIAVLSLARGGDAFSLSNLRTEGRQLLLRDAVTHQLIEFGSNDIFTGATLAAVQAGLIASAAPSIGRGQPTYATTITPRTTSSNGWINLAGQTVVNAGYEAARLAYNAWLRANFVSLGLAGIFDMGRAIDPTDTGKWAADAGTSFAPSTVAAGFPTVAAGAVTGCFPGYYNGGSSVGGGYGVGPATVACLVTSYPGTGGSGAVIVGNVAAGQTYISSYTVTTPGALYTAAPMVTPISPWTADGIHPNAAGYNAVFAATALSPDSFAVTGGIELSMLGGIPRNAPSLLGPVSITGGSPMLVAAGGATNVDLTLGGKGASVVSLYSGSSPALSVGTSPGGVNYLYITGSLTGAAVALTATGTDTNIPITVLAKGAAIVALGSNNNFSLSTGAPVSGVNYVYVAGATTGSAPSVNAIGADTNVDLKLLGQGTGAVQAGTGGWNTGPLRLGGIYLWVDSSTRLRIKATAPVSDTDGTVVGTQT